MYLVDTNVVSELRKSSASRGRSATVDRNLLAWTQSVPAASQFLSVISILELETGALLMERRDPRQGAVLRSWLQNYVLPTFDGRILPVDTPVAQKCAALHVPNPRSQRDALIAATAMVHGMTVVTRNISDFEPTGVALLNPWQP
ncbi:MAG: type II toxin-antitoxin system VapC family toxin [Terracidiphilus sp.]